MPFPDRPSSLGTQGWLTVWLEERRFIPRKKHSAVSVIHIDVIWLLRLPPTMMGWQAFKHLLSMG